MANRIAGITVEINGDTTKLSKALEGVNKDISAYIMGMEEFDDAAFTEQVKEISVQADGSLAFQFFDGRTRIWQKA